MDVFTFPSSRKYNAASGPTVSFPLDIERRDEEEEKKREFRVRKKHVANVMKKEEKKERG